MKAVALVWRYTDSSSFGIVRVYLDDNFDKADDDLEMMITHASDSKSWELRDVVIYNTKRDKK